MLLIDFGSGQEELGIDVRRGYGGFDEVLMYSVLSAR